jgi:hypothetical protein
MRACQGSRLFYHQMKAAFLPVHWADLQGHVRTARLHSSLRRLVAQLQAQFVVNAMGLLQIDLPSLAAQKDMDPPVAVTDPRGANLVDPCFQAGLLAAARFVVIGGPIEFQHAARPPDRHAPTPSAPCRRMNAFWASENCDVFIVFRPSQPRENTAENSNSERPSFRGADQIRPAGRTKVSDDEPINWTPPKT